MTKPLVSVIIPVYNGKKWIEDALQSVFDQTYKNYEILLIDDGSTDDITQLDIIKDKRIIYYKNTNHGVAYSRNFGIDNAKGKYIAFLDCDDFWCSEKLEVQVSAMESNKSKWSQHSYYYFDDIRHDIISRINTYIYKNNSKKMQFCSFKIQTSCIMVERDAVNKIKAYFDENKTFGEDNFFYLQMSKHYPLLCINQYLGYFRIRNNNAGFDIEKQFMSRAEIWNELKLDEFFRINTSFYVKLAYRYCYIIMKIVHKLKIKNSLTLKLLYLYPWSTFKIASKCLQ